MIHAQALDFVQRYQHPRQEKLVLLLQRKRKSIDYRAEDLQQLCYAIEAFGLIDKLEEDIVNGTTDVGAKVEKFAVYSVQSSFQEVSFTRVLGVEEFEKLSKSR